MNANASYPSTTDESNVLPGESETRISELDRHGYTMFRGFLPAMDVARAHDDLVACFERDRADRVERDVSDSHHDGPSGHTVLTAPSHLMIDVYGRSPTLDSLVEDILTRPESAAVIKALAGEHYVFYGYNIRYMSGEYDPAPAHELHRDSYGEFGIGILLTDVEPAEHAATAFVPGTHKLPYCPRWRAYLDSTCRQLERPFRFLLKLRVFNRLLARRIYARYSGAFGKRGDVYVFTNDTWHGRHPNLHGGRAMVMLLGSAPSHITLHHSVHMPDERTLAELPPTVRRHLCEREAAGGPEEETLLKKMLDEREPLEPFGLLNLARLERHVLDRLFAFLRPGYTWSLTCFFNLRDQLDRLRHGCSRRFASLSARRGG